MWQGGHSTALTVNLEVMNATPVTATLLHATGAKAWPSWDGFSGFTLPFPALPHTRRRSQAAVPQDHAAWMGARASREARWARGLSSPSTPGSSCQHPTNSPTGSSRTAHSIKHLRSLCSESPLTLRRVSCLLEAAQETLLHLHCFQHPQISSPPLPGFGPERCWVIGLSSRKMLKAPPWTLRHYSHLISLRALPGQCCNSDTRYASLPPSMQTRATGTSPSLTCTRASLSFQSTKQNKELPTCKCPQEEEPHVADATALLNASFKAFRGLYRCDE